MARDLEDHLSRNAGSDPRFITTITAAAALIVVGPQFANDVVAKIGQAPLTRSAVVEQLVPAPAFRYVALVERQFRDFVR